MTENEMKALFDKMRDGIDLTNEEMIALARNTGYMAGQFKRLEVGTDNLVKNFKKAGDELPAQLAKAAGNTAKQTAIFAKGLADANEGFRQLNPVIDAIASAASGIPIISGMAKATAEASKFMIDQLQNATDAFNTISKVGGLTASGMSGLQQQFLRSGMSLKGYTKTITDNSSALANFAGNVGAGAEKFSQVADASIDFREGLMRLGFQIDELGEFQASFITRQTQLGLAQGKSTSQLAAGAAEYSKELNLLANATGVSRKEIEKQQNAALSESRFRAQYDEMVANGQEKQAKAMLDFQSIVNNVAPELAQGLRDVSTGFTNSDAAIKLFNTTNGKGQEIMARLQSGQIDQSQAYKELQGAVQGNIETTRNQAKTMGDNPVFTKYAESSKLLNSQVDSMGNLVKQQNDQMSGKGDQLTNETVAAQKSMQEMGRMMNQLGFEFMPAAATAVKGFTSALHSVISMVNKTMGTNVSTGAGGDPAKTQGMGSKIVDQILGNTGSVIGGAIGGVASGITTIAKSGYKAFASNSSGAVPGPTAALGAGPAFSRPDDTRADKVQLTLEEIREELKKLVKVGGIPSGGAGGQQAAGGTGGVAAPSMGAPTMPIEIPTGDKIGKVSEKWESGGRGSGVVGWDPGGGTSYGKYQIASKVGSTKAFLNFAEKSGRKDVAEKLRTAGFENDTGGTTGKAVDVWKDMAAKGELGDLEHQFIKSQSYDVAMKGLSPELQKRVGGSKALQEMLWSSAVHHGGGGKGTPGAAGIFGEVYKEGMSDEDLIKGVYANRGTRFGNQPENIRKSIQNIRFPQEQATILAMRQAEMAGGAAPLTTAAAPTVPLTTAPAPTVPVSTALATPRAPTAAPAYTAATAGLAGQGQNVISTGLSAITTALFGGGAQGAPGTAESDVGGSEAVALLQQLVVLSRDQNSNLSKILSASTA
jgi:hypothetical protein